MQYAETLERYAPYALAALRIVAALIFMAHGTQKLFGFPAPPEKGLPSRSCGSAASWNLPAASWS